MCDIQTFFYMNGFYVYLLYFYWKSAMVLLMWSYSNSTKSQYLFKKIYFLYVFPYKTKMLFVRLIALYPYIIPTYFPTIWVHTYLILYYFCKKKLPNKYCFLHPGYSRPECWCHSVSTGRFLGYRVWCWRPRKIN